MKSPIARFTVRRTMVSVAVLAVLLGLGIEGERARRRAEFRREADEASKAALVARISAMGFEKRASRPGSHPFNKRMADRERLMANYWDRLRDRNERADSRSWASISPDDPPLLPHPAAIRLSEFPDLKIGDPAPD
jgi:hypothetical protein